VTDRSGDELVVDLDRRSVAVTMAAVVAVVVLFAAGRAARDGLTFVGLGTLLALALSPVVAMVQRTVAARRGVAVGLVLVAFIGAVALVVVLLGPPAVRQAREVSEELPQVLQQLTDLPIVGDDLERADAPAKVQEWIEDLPRRLGADASPVQSAATSLLGGVVAAFAVLLVAVSLLLDGERLVQGLRRAVPRRHRPLVDRIGDLVYRIVGRYFAGSLLVAMIAGLNVLIIGTLLGVPLTPLAAIWITCTNLIPQIGGFLGGSVFVMLGATEGASTAVICLAWFLVYQQFENHILAPTIVGDAVDLSPPVTMVAALVGASAGGVPGALVAVPLVGTAKAVYLELRGRQSPEPTEPGRLTRLARLRRRVLRRRRREGEPPPAADVPTPASENEGAPVGPPQ